MLDSYLGMVTEGDCVDLMQTLRDNCIDVTFADPPFNLGKKYNGYRDSKSRREYVMWCETWLREMVRITKPSGSIFVHNIPKWLTYYSAILNELAYFKHWISWDAPTAPMGKTLQPAHYGILFYAKDYKKQKFYEVRYPHARCRECRLLMKDYGGKKHLLHSFGPLASDVWTDIHRIRHSKYRDEHPCQLPIHLLERIILMTTDEGDVVLDPFSGTGTTLIASKRLGRRYVGFDIDPKYVEIATAKLSKERPLQKLGGAYISTFARRPVTIRDVDWSEVSQFFDFPDQPKMIDRKEAVLEGNLTSSAKSNQEILDFRDELAKHSQRDIPTLFGGSKHVGPRRERKSHE